MSSGATFSSRGTLDALQAQIRQEGALEKHFCVQEISDLWGLSQNAVREIFKEEPGVVRIERPRSRYKRAYTTIRVPKSVLERVHRRMSFVA
jgi:hypothetical protein